MVVPMMSHVEHVAYLAGKEERGIHLSDLERCVLKRERGEPLTKREERVLAYGYDAPGCPSCRRP